MEPGVSESAFQMGEYPDSRERKTVVEKRKFVDYPFFVEFYKHGLILES
jgi:hypothetical protein